MSDPQTRRFFLGALTAASAVRVWGANDKVTIGIVGLGGRGSSHLNTYTGLAEAQVIGLCDVNQAAREKAQGTLARKGLEKGAGNSKSMQRDVRRSGRSRPSRLPLPTIGTALCVRFWRDESRQGRLRRKASLLQHSRRHADAIQVQRETKRIMQVGSQHRSWPFKVKAIAALQQGLIGKLYMSKALCYKLRPSIGHTPDTPTPPGVNWDLFLGPAPMRPFNQKRFAYYWHWFWDTGNGDIGNQGVHETGIARWALGDPMWPKTAMAFGGKFGIDDDTETPNTLTAGFSYGDEQLVIEVRGKMTNGEGTRQAHVVTAGPRAAQASRSGLRPALRALRKVGPSEQSAERRGWQSLL